MTFRTSSHFSCFILSVFNPRALYTGRYKNNNNSNNDNNVIHGRLTGATYYVEGRNVMDTTIAAYGRSQQSTETGVILVERRLVYTESRRECPSVTQYAMLVLSQKIHQYHRVT